MHTSTVTARRNVPRYVKKLSECPRSLRMIRDNVSILHAAVYINSTNLTEFILMNKDCTDVNVIDTDGVTPLEFSILMGYPEQVRLLLEHGATLKKDMMHVFYDALKDWHQRQKWSIMWTSGGKSLHHWFFSNDTKPYQQRRILEDVVACSPIHDSVATAELETDMWLRFMPRFVSYETFVLETCATCSRGLCKYTKVLRKYLGCVCYGAVGPECELQVKDILVLASRGHLTHRPNATTCIRKNMAPKPACTLYPK